MSAPHRFTRRTGLKAALAVAASVPLSSTVLPTASASGAERQGPPLHIMSFNLKGSNTAAPSWGARRPVTRELLRREQPHVIGTQEGVYQQLREIKNDLGSSYDWIGTGIEGGSRGAEHAAIIYDVHRLEPTEHYTFWLSGTPETIGSNTWGGGYPRVATWVRFKDLLDGGRQFYVLSTHFDHKSQDAQKRSATLMARRIGKLARVAPVLLTGDFNVAAHKSPVYTEMLRGGLVDTWDKAAERSALYGTFHGYKPLTANGDRIDWILSTPGITTQRASINTFSVNGQFPSDHLPVQAWVTVR
ncbi:endonuclease/exonuclease/phosphatase family protein [Streptomyces sp. NPDC001508]|uniref:endonuclease/exonuclease/phosphatase family protein n=1 Tax=Streptomyces sp. NPDC001508 TaxID=3154656 RepID=UPI0033188F5F